MKSLVNLSLSRNAAALEEFFIQWDDNHILDCHDDVPKPATLVSMLEQKLYNKCTALDPTCAAWLEASWGLIELFLPPCWDREEANNLQVAASAADLQNSRNVI